jgi:hypothetical protein
MEVVKVKLLEVDPLLHLGDDLRKANLPEIKERK